MRADDARAVARRPSSPGRRRPGVKEVSWLLVVVFFCGAVQDGGDAFQGARAAAALEAIALVLALTFPDTAAVPDFRAQGSVGKVGTGA